MSYFETLYKPCLLDRHRIKVVSQPEFIILVNTALAGSASDTMQLPIRGTNMTIDWGDGFVQTGVNQSATPASANWITRQYASSGQYQIKISGGLNWIFFNNMGDRLKLLEIRNWGIIEWQLLASSFYGCGNMIGTFTDSPNLTNCTNLANLFLNCTNFNSDIIWDTGGVLNFDRMFENAVNFDSTVIIDTSSAITFERMFQQTLFSGKGNIETWNTSNVRNMSQMFRSLTSINNIFNKDISNWNTSKVTNMFAMFLHMTEFNQDLSGWCVPLIATEPDFFATGATNWILPKPIWGTCP